MDAHCKLARGLVGEKREGEYRYYAPSVFSQRVETLMHLRLAGLRESEVRVILEEVAALQHSLGHTEGVKEATRKLGGAWRSLRVVPPEDEERKSG